MPTCQQCGRCCLGLDWTFSYNEPDEDPDNISEELMDKAKDKLHRYGIRYHEFKSAKKSKHWIALTFKVGVCQHLRFEDGKGACAIHDDRHPICKNYFCDKCK